MSDQPPPPPPPSSGGGDHRSSKADAKAAKAHAKAMRPWYKKKRWIGLIALVLLVGISAVASGGDDDDETPTAAGGGATERQDSDEDSGDGGDEECPPTGDDTRNQCLYPDRPDSQSDDHEQLVGGSVRLAGFTATLNSVEFQPAADFTEDCVLVDVTVENRDDSAQPYNTFDWRIQTEGGQVLDPGFCSFGADNNIGSGDLVTGGTVNGTVGFEVAPGTYFIIYKPDPFSSARGIWQVEVG